MSIRGQRDSAGQAVRIAGALLIFGAGEGCPIGVVTGQQTGLVTDTQVAFGKLVHDDGQRTKCMRAGVVGSCRTTPLKVTVLSLRTTRSCLADSSISRSIPAIGVKALSAWAGVTVKPRLKSGTKTSFR